eukprot:221119-Prymnesium_polylepis.1
MLAYARAAAVFAPRTPPAVLAFLAHAAPPAVLAIAALADAAGRPDARRRSARLHPLCADHVRRRHPRLRPRCAQRRHTQLRRRLLLVGVGV